MEIVLPLEKMTTSDKLSAMEILWDDICRKSDNDFKSPDWHGEILKSREKRVQEGKAQFSDLTDVKERLRKSL